MAFRARAPGKLVVLGEYAVLEGAPALVMAVDRYCRATVEATGEERSALRTLAPESREVRFRLGEPTGSALVDLVREAYGAAESAPFSATLDSRDFFAAGSKLGLGSSAAALVAFAAAFTAQGRARGAALREPGLAELVTLHRRFQGGAGSGLDVAAAFTGGVISYRLDVDSVPRIGSVQLPNSVGFAGVFAGRSASTPGLLTRYRSWGAEQPAAAAELKRTMGDVAEFGVAAAREDDGEAFLDALAEYGRCLDALGRAMQVDVLTAEHRAIGSAAASFGVVYKVSGAGGGDLGLAFARDPEALETFCKTIAGQGFLVVNLNVDVQGRVVEELAQ